ncbi:MAG TPA: DJ-1 family glyoxalase III [Polyangiaceae bacterium]
MRALVLLAEGFEEIEAVTIVDVLRRGGVKVTTAALGTSLVRGSHGIAIEADTSLDGLRVDTFDAVVLPGGMPGAKHLRDDTRVQSLLCEAAARDKLVGAICAAPIALDAAGLLDGKRATAYPGHEIRPAIYVEEDVVTDGNIVTSRGVGTALDFALALVERLAGSDTASRLRVAMLVEART